MAATPSILQDLLDLVVGAVIWLGNSPERLRRSPTGIAMANRAVQICWSLSRHPTSASSQVLSLFRCVGAYEQATVTGSEWEFMVGVDFLCS
jgi:hypothetical protein